MVKGNQAQARAVSKTVRSDSQEKSTTDKIRYYDYSLVAVLIFLVCFGLVMLYSTSSYSALTTYGDSMYYFRRQLIFCVLGFVAMFFIARYDYRKLANWAWPVYIISIILMFLVITPLGREVNGARRWLQLPFGQSFQPSEVAKIAVILLIPVAICKMGQKIQKLSGILQIILLYGGVSAACVYFLTDNLSAAIIVIGIACVLVFVVHPKTAPFMIFLGIAVALAAVAVLLISANVTSSDNFRLRRIIAWLNPEEYASDIGYQTLQGLYAIGSGGLFGKGLGNSAQKTIIPEVQNDMILSVICEELGIFGVILVLVLFGMLLYRLLFIARNAPDLYGSLVVTGIFAHIALQVILNVAVVTNLIPNTGITLPFISYGGTSVLFLMIEMGIALSVSRQIELE